MRLLASLKKLFKYRGRAVFTRLKELRKKTVCRAYKKITVLKSLSLSFYSSHHHSTLSKVPAPYEYNKKC